MYNLKHHRTGKFVSTHKHLIILIMHQKAMEPFSKGDEESIKDAASYCGFMPENAPHFKALLVYIEHRFYGASISFKEALGNTSLLGYFSSTQALADYAELIIDLKRNLSAENSPVIVVGGSYGGSKRTCSLLSVYKEIALLNKNKQLTT
ncbi:hypothetical protein IFM89_034371 [Coptis chinensis]|uniref:Uncharacterized protein n=1 Tax=Coptis chinensis TaxID=261450 RepID=A0A835HD52_9MAGN|nr:hypothetical protein IFM89_034371 [Coptis chinensis]